MAELDMSWTTEYLYVEAQEPRRDTFEDFDI